MRVSLFLLLTFNSLLGQQPVLNWSARVGSNLQQDYVSAVAADEGVWVASTQTDNQLHLEKLSTTGASIECSLKFGGGGRSRPTAMLVLEDESIVVAGLTTSEDFPFTGSRPVPTSSGYAFLARLQGCNSTPIRAVAMPVRLRTTSMAQGPDGDVYVSGLNLERNGFGMIYRYTAVDLGLKARRETSGIVTALKLSKAGSVFVTGMRPDRNAFVAGFGVDLGNELFDKPIRGSIVSVGRALAVNEDESVWVASEGDLGRFASSPGFSYEENGFLVFFRSAAILQRIGRAGEIQSEEVIEYFRDDLQNSFRRPLALWFGPDGRMWCAIGGTTMYPFGAAKGQFGLETVQPGVVLRSIGQDGSIDSDVTFLPGAQAQVSLGGSGRVAVLSSQAGIPLSPGAFGNPEEHNISVVAFQQRNAHEAPALGAYDSILEAEVQRIQSITNYVRVRTTLTSSAPEPMEFTAGIVSGNLERSTGFEIVKVESTLPAEVTLEPKVNYEFGAGLLVLVPGAQGTIYLPLRGRLSELSLSGFFDRALSLPGPSSSSIETNLTVRFIHGKTDPALPFRIRSTEPWLIFAQQEATTPATISATIDPRGMAAGSSRTAAVVFDFGSFQREFRFTFNVGPRIELEVRPPDYFVIRGQDFRHKLTLSSTGAPLDFQIGDVSAWMKISPMSGRTPQELEFTIDSNSIQPLSRATALFGVRGANFSFVFQNVYFGLPEQPSIPLPGSIAREQVPGSLLVFSGGPSRCDASSLQAIPWPEALGGCSVRIGGKPVPLGMTREVKREPSTQGAFLPTYDMAIQIPSDLPLGPTKMEVEDKNGRVTSYDLFLVEFAPRIASTTGNFISSFTGQPGEKIRFKVSGTGTTSLVSRPTLRLGGNVGGKPAKITSWQASAELQGVHEIELEIPTLLPGQHLVNLQINEVSLWMGQLTITN